jgi:hypothetical protein
MIWLIEEYVIPNKPPIFSFVNIPASIIVGDNPGLFSYGANEESFEKTGLMDAAGGHYENIGNDSVKVDFNPDFLPWVSLSKAVVDADIIISWMRIYPKWMLTRALPVFAVRKCVLRRPLF